jgi:apolipoprotein N-acyltransferase
VSALVVFANVALARAVVHLAGRRRQPDGGAWWQPAAVGLLAPLLVLSLAGRFAAGPRPPLESPATAEAGSPVRLVQPDIYNQTAYDPQVSSDNYQRLLRLSDQACDLPGSLVIWPESATWPYEYRREDFHTRRVEEFTSDRGCPLLLNSTTRTDDGLLFNSVYLVSEGRAVERYDKRKLVPFGEYVPLKNVFAFLGRIARASGDYDAADRVTLLPWGAQKLGVAICFEVTYPGETAELVRHGATTLVTVTNDAWYGDSSAPRQHFRAAQWRAAETRRPLLRAAITGISGVVGPDGAVRDRMEVGEEGVLATRILGRTDLTPFVRAPWLPPLTAGLVALFAIILTARRPAFGQLRDAETPPQREKPARPDEQPGDTTP